MDLRIAAWCSEAEDREGHERSFLEEIRVFHVTPSFRTPDDLQRQVEARLRTIAAEDLAPWCKLGTSIFRATEITDDGNEIRLTARVRSEEVDHALEALRGHGGFRGDDARITWNGRSRSVRLISMKVTTTAARSKTFVIALERREDQRNHLIEISMNGYTAAQLTQAALKSALFGESNPLADRHLGFIAETPDPLAGLRSASVPDEISRPLAELLIVEALVGSGRAARIKDFRLGAKVGGRRRLAFGWKPLALYSGEPAETMGVDGFVAL